MKLLMNVQKNSKKETNLSTTFKQLYTFDDIKSQNVLFQPHIWALVDKKQIKKITLVKNASWFDITEFYKSKIIL